MQSTIHIWQTAQKKRKENNTYQCWEIKLPRLIFAGNPCPLFDCAGALILLEVNNRNLGPAKVAMIVFFEFLGFKE